MTEPLFVQYDDGLCAVEGCDNAGRPQICPYDGKYHHHGKIHYSNDHRLHPQLRFKRGPWRGICNPHMVEIDAATAEHKEGLRR